MPMFVTADAITTSKRPAIATHCVQGSGHGSSARVRNTGLIDVFKKTFNFELFEWCRRYNTDKVSGNEGWLKQSAHESNIRQKTDLG
jgi:hypothetical protein